MDGKLNFSDYLTIAVLTVALFLAAQWWLGKRKGCGCARPATPGKANDLPPVTTRRACA
jgi:hypothetical protein